MAALHTDEVTPPPPVHAIVREAEFLHPQHVSHQIGVPVRAGKRGQAIDIPDRDSRILGRIYDGLAGQLEFANRRSGALIEFSLADSGDRGLIPQGPMIFQGRLTSHFGCPPARRGPIPAPCSAGPLATKHQFRL